MIKRIFLHIGLHKTGTTAIQEALAANRNILRLHDFLYPEFKADHRILNNHSVPIYSMFSDFPEKYRQNIKIGLTNCQEIAQMHQNYREQLQQQIADFQGENLIISGEDICSLKKTEMLRLKEYLVSLSIPEVKFVVLFVIRHPVDWHRSRLQEYVKAGRTFPDVFRMLKINEKSKMLRNIINKTSAVFDEKNILCFRYEDMMKHNKGLIGAFFDLLHLDGNIVQIPADCLVNVSMSYEGVKLLSRIFYSYPLVVEGMLNPALSGFKPEMLFATPGVKYSLPEHVNKMTWDVHKNDYLSFCKRFQLPEYKYYKTKRCNNSLKWGKNVQVFLVAAFPKMPEMILEIVLEVLISELKRYRRVFDWPKKLSILTIVIFYSCYLKTKSTLRKLNAFKLRLSKFPDSVVINRAKPSGTER